MDITIDINIDFESLDVPFDFGHVYHVMTEMNGRYGIVVHVDDPDSNTKEYVSMRVDAWNDEVLDWHEHVKPEDAMLVAYGGIIDRMAGMNPFAKWGLRVDDHQVVEFTV